MQVTNRWAWVRRQETLLLVLVPAVIAVNLSLSPYVLQIDNLVNVFVTSIEESVIALTMTFIIISGEIDLSVAAVLALCACAFGWLYQNGVSTPLAIVLTLGLGALCGAFNGMWIAYLGLPSLAVTLAGLIGYRGLAYAILEDKSVESFPDWFTASGQNNIPGLPFPPTLLLFVGLFIVVFVVLHYSAFGRYIYAIGNNKEASHFAGVKVRRIKWTLFTISGLMAALAGLMFAARFGSVRADDANGGELDIITMVVFGGVSIFGGSGSLVGVGLSILIVLSLRNGMTLASMDGSVQTSVIGGLLVLSLLLPNVFHDARLTWRRLRHVPIVLARKEEIGPAKTSPPNPLSTS